jgi:hypothetical protein
MFRSSEDTSVERCCIAMVVHIQRAAGPCILILSTQTDTSIRDCKWQLDTGSKAV